MTVEHDVREFVRESFYVTDDAELTENVSLIDSGIVDSTGMMDIILFLESRYAISIEDHETTPENLETISRIASFVARKQAAATA